MKFKKSLKFAAIILSIITLFQTLQNNSYADNISVHRIMGENRYATSAKISQKSYSSADTVIIANGDKYPDALSGGQLAIALKAPILLVSQNNIPKEIESELARLSPKKVIILGQTSSVSANIESKLKVKYNVERLGGHDRYSTSRLIMNKTKSITNSKELVLVSGKSYPDALSAAGYLKDRNALIILSDGEAKIDFDGKITAIGGKSSIRLPWFNGVRISGSDRYDTSLKIASLIKKSNMILASGNNFPDALSAVDLVTSKDASLILVDNRLSKVQEKYIKENASNVFIVGGYASLSNYIEGQLGNDDILTVDKVYKKDKIFTKKFAPINVAFEGKYKTPYVKDRYLLTFDPYASKETIENIIWKMNATIASYNPILNMYAVESRLPENVALKVIERNRNNAFGLKSATYDYLGNIDSNEVNDPWELSLSREQKKANVFFDWRKNIGEDKIWKTYDEIENSGKNVKVGVLDIEFDLGHEDLIDNFSYNKNTDNDNTGEVYANMMNNRFETKKSHFGKYNISGGSHGTHVSGIIGAMSNNNTGMNGVLRDVNMLPYDIGEYTTSGNFISELFLGPGKLIGGSVSSSKIYNGLTSLIENDAKVINLSAGHRLTNKKDANHQYAVDKLFPTSKQLTTIMVDGLAKGKDFVIVTSAGNGDKEGKRYGTFYNGFFSSIDKKMAEESIKERRDYIESLISFIEKDSINHNLNYPNKSDESLLKYNLKDNLNEFKNIQKNLKALKPEDILNRIIVVGASDKNNRQAYFSNDSCFERNVDIYAPGVDIYSTIFRTYDFMSGTSMATPVVSGAAGLVYQLCPDANGKDVKDIIINSSSTGNNSIKVAPSNKPENESGTSGFLVNLNSIVNKYKEKNDEEKAIQNNENLKLNFVDAATNNPIEPRAYLLDDSGNREYINTEGGVALVDLKKNWKKIRAELNGYISIEENIDNLNSKTTIAMTKNLANNSVRVVLTWGSDPSDYDSHIYGTLSENKEMKHVYYLNFEDSYLKLDTDKTTSYGPETITIENIDKFDNLTYTVHDYTNKSSTDSDSKFDTPPVVKVYRGNRLIKEYRANRNANFTYWKVFSISKDGSLVDKNEYGFENEADLIPNH